MPVNFMGYLKYNFDFKLLDQFLFSTLTVKEQIITIPVFVLLSI